MENQRNCSEDGSAADTIIACEHETWSLIQRKDLNGFARYLAEDFYDIFPDGQERTKSELLEFLRGAVLQDYRLSNFRVTMLTQEAAIVTYQADFHAVIQGRDMSMKESVTSGWAKRDGRWLNVSAVGSARHPQHSK
jgi:ketosteroid isomerase-like protein